MTTYIGTVSYAAAAVTFLFLSVLLLTSWRGRIEGAMLTCACLVSALWAAVTAWQASQGRPALLIVDVLEVLRNGLWFAFLIMLLGFSRQSAKSSVSNLRVVAGLVTVFCLFLLAVTILAFPQWSLPYHSGDLGSAVIARVILAVTGLVLVEHLYRNADPEQRWGIKFICLGMAGMFVYDFYLYSDAMLFRHVDPNIWDARGIINVMIVPLIAVSTARNPKWSLDIFVSRHILYHSIALFGAGIYLLFMAAVGYYIRIFGGNWGAVLQTTFLFGALLVLLILLFSGTMRSRLKVFLNKHFFSYKYDYREEWLRFTRTLSGGEPGVQLREQSIQAVATLVESPGAALWFVQDSGAFELVAQWNMPGAIGSEKAGSQLCYFLENQQWVINLEEYEVNPGIYGKLKIPEWLSTIPRAWLVVPLILHERLLGFIVLARSRGQVHLNWEVSDLLKTAAHQTASYLAQLEAAQALLIARQFESFNRMSAFVVHDLKNLVAQLSLLLTNSEKHRNNPAFQQDMTSTVEHSVTKMKRLLMQLRGGNQAIEKPGVVLLDELLTTVVANKTGFRPKPLLEVSDMGLHVFASRERLERVFGNLIQNAIEATPDHGQVTIRVARRENFALVEVIDTGRGMSEQFIRDGLFKPFESTKPTGMGIGTYESREYVRELGGQMEVSSRESVGTTFRVVLPLYMSEEEFENEPITHLRGIG